MAIQQVDDELVSRLNWTSGCTMQVCRGALLATAGKKYKTEEKWLNAALNWLRDKRLYKGELQIMAEISAALVGKLREKTGARLMDCKKALTETQKEGAGDEGKWTAAAEAWLRTKNIATGAQAAEKSASEGLLGHKVAGNAITVVEMTANTDFVAKNDEFKKMLSDLVDLADANKIDSAEKLSALSLNGVAVPEAVKLLAGKIGENIGIKRVVRVDGEFGHYIHHNDKEGAIVELSGVTGEKAKAVGKDIAMHVVFAKPLHLTREEVPQELIKKETDIAAEKLKNDPKNANKPADILTKIVQGQVNKFYGSIVLPDQPYYKDGAKTVAAVLKESGATVKRFVRFQVGVI